MSSFSQLVEWLGTNPWWGFVSFIIGVLAVLVAIILSFKSKRVKLPCYAVRSRNIVKDLVSKFDALETLYSGQTIENLTVTKILFWNAGRDTIHRGDIAVPLTVHVSESYKILDAKILSSKEPANKFSIDTSADQSSSILNLDYVDKDEGVVIQLIHTGRSGKDIEFDGKIKGAGELIKKTVPQSDRSQFRYQPNPSLRQTKILSYIMAALLLLVAFSAIVTAFMTGEFILSGFLAATYGGLGFWIIILQRRIPKGFDDFWD